MMDNIPVTDFNWNIAGQILLLYIKRIKCFSKEQARYVISTSIFYCTVAMKKLLQRYYFIRQYKLRYLALSHFSLSVNVYGQKYFIWRKLKRLLSPDWHFFFKSYWSIAFSLSHFSRLDLLDPSISSLNNFFHCKCTQHSYHTSSTKTFVSALKAYYVEVHV